MFSQEFCKIFCCDINFLLHFCGVVFIVDVMVKFQKLSFASKFL